MNRQPLLGMDRLMAALHRSLRRGGRPGALIQTHVWLRRPPDVERVRQSLLRLGRRYPDLNARLVSGGWEHLAWERPALATPALGVTDLPRPAEPSARAYAERLLATPLDPELSDPVQFHLLRPEDGRAVFLVHWVHLLMEGPAAELLVRELHALDTDPTLRLNSASPRPTIP
jgi:hypothetical protein